MSWFDIFCESESCLVVSNFSATSRTVGCQAPLPMGFCRQEYRSGLPIPSLGNLPNPGIEPRSPALQADSLQPEPPEKLRILFLLHMYNCLPEVLVTQSCPTLWDPMDARLLRPWDFRGKSIGVGCHFLLQGTFPTQGLNPGLLHCRQTLYRLSHQGSTIDIRDTSK